jgi:hypothetical protein
LYYESWYHLWCSGSTNEFFVRFVLRNLGGIYLFREWEYISFNSIVRIIDQIVKTSSSGYNKIPLEQIVRENPSLISSGNNFWPDFPNSATKLWTTGSFFPENQGTNAKKKYSNIIKDLSHSCMLDEILSPQIYQEGIDWWDYVKSWKSSSWWRLLARSFQQKVPILRIMLFVSNNNTVVLCM